VVRALTISCVIALLATPAAAAPKRPPPPPPVLTPFSGVAAEGGEAATLLSHGPLELLLICRSGAAFLGFRTAEDRTMITSHAAHTFGPSGVSEVAVMVGVAEQGYVGTASVADHAARGIAGFTGSGASAITPAGRVLTVSADGVGYGIKLFNHNDVVGTNFAWIDAPDCFVTGHAVLQQVDVLP
jgi:hypothetical protein